jgi:LDH2 family malate/lactate/ureidoglycolate dehydrogenase
MSDSTRTEQAAFLHYAIARVAAAAGMSAIHADYIADAIVFANRQGKLNQGLGVYEAIDLALEAGVLDVDATPELVTSRCSTASAPAVTTR